LVWEEALETMHMVETPILKWPKLAGARTELEIESLQTDLRNDA